MKLFISKAGNKPKTKTHKTKIQRFNFQKIRFKLIGAFIVPVGLIIFLGIISYSKASTGIIKNYESASETTLNMLSQYFNLGLDSIYAKAIEINTNEKIKSFYSGIYVDKTTNETITYDDVKDLVRAIAVSDKIINSAFLIVKDAEGVSSYKALPEDTYQEFLKSEEGQKLPDLGLVNYWSGIHEYLDRAVSRDDKEYCMALYKNFYDKSYKMIGYIILDVKMDFVKEALKKLNLGENTITALVTDDGREILAQPLDEDFSFSSQEYYKLSKSSEDLSGYRYETYNGQQYLYLYSKVTNGNAMICSLIPKDMITKQAEGVKTVTFLVVIVACVIAILTGSIISSGISKTIRNINTGLSKAATGDLTANIKTNRKDEFLALCNSINTMIAAMKSLITKMTGVSGNVASSSVEVSTNSDLFLDAVKQINYSINTIDQGLSQQASDSEVCLIQMEGLSNQIDMLTEKTSAMSDIAHLTRGVVNSGIGIIDDLNQKSKDTANITQSVIEDIQRLESESSTISNIVATINNISKQTNLLSLNASIEAARAGNAGSGFAVVASEILKLAVQSANSANQIGIIIKSIEAQTERTVLTAKKAESIVSTQENALQKTIEIFSDINVQVGNLLESINTILDGIDKIEVTKKDTLCAIDSISAASQQVTATSGELKLTADNQLSTVQLLNKAAERLKADAKNLEDTVHIFKI